jgi:hypothetical protein
MPVVQPEMLNQPVQKKSNKSRVVSRIYIFQSIQLNNNLTISPQNNKQTCLGLAQILQAKMEKVLESKIVMSVIVLRAMVKVLKQYKIQFTALMLL